MTLQDLKRKEDAENEGVWEPFPKPLNGEGLIAHGQNPEFQAKLRRAVDSWRKRNKRAGRLPPAEDIPAAEMDILVRDAMVGTTLKGIRGVEQSPGVALANTPENLRAILDTRDGFDFVAGVSRSIEAEIEEVVEEARGNSQPSSAGASAAVS